MTAETCSGHRTTYNAYCVECVTLRLAAAERVVEAARRVDEDTDGRLTEAQFSLRNELIGYEKVYIR